MSNTNTETLFENPKAGDEFTSRKSIYLRRCEQPIHSPIGIATSRSLLKRLRIPFVVSLLIMSISGSAVTANAQECAERCAPNSICAAGQCVILCGPCGVGEMCGGSGQCEPIYSGPVPTCAGNEEPFNGRCISLCRPGCAGGSVCTSAGSCVSLSASPTPTSAPAQAQPVQRSGGQPAGAYPAQPTRPSGPVVAQRNPSAGAPQYAPQYPAAPMYRSLAPVEREAQEPETMWEFRMGPGLMSEPGQLLVIAFVMGIGVDIPFTETLGLDVRVGIGAGPALDDGFALLGRAEVLLELEPGGHFITGVGTRLVYARSEEFASAPGEIGSAMLFHVIAQFGWGGRSFEVVAVPGIGLGSRGGMAVGLELQAAFRF